VVEKIQTQTSTGIYGIIRSRNYLWSYYYHRWISKSLNLHQQNSDRWAVDISFIFCFENRDENNNTCGVKVNLFWPLMNAMHKTFKDLSGDSRNLLKVEDEYCVKLQ